MRQFQPKQNAKTALNHFSYFCQSQHTSSFRHHPLAWRANSR